MFEGCEEQMSTREMREEHTWALGPFPLKLRINDKLPWNVILLGVCFLIFAHLVALSQHSRSKAGARWPTIRIAEMQGQ